MNPLNFLAFGGIGSGELIIIFLIVLLVFGAKRLPELARALGQAKKEFQKASREVTDELHKDEKTGEAVPKAPSNGASSSDTKR
jgi:sec-independent protein translocase protein TatA